MSERHAYKLLYPIARLETHNQLLTNFIQTEMIEPMRSQDYTSELFTSQNYMYLRYINTFGKGFYLKPKKGEKVNDHQSKVGKQSAVAPVKMLVH